MARVERALLAYVRGQTLVSLTIGGPPRCGMWILGVTGIFPSGETYALAFGAFTAVTEVIPYIGPWLGALAPLAVAATYSPTAVLAVALVYLFIHQIEGHIVVRKLMGGAVKVHPLAVIFALLAGEELYGIGGDPGDAAAGCRRPGDRRVPARADRRHQLARQPLVGQRLDGARSAASSNSRSAASSRPWRRRNLPYQRCARERSRCHPGRRRKRSMAEV